MDSGNSGSLQSSSAGEDDYDFTGPNTGATISIHAPTPPPPPPPPSSSSTSLFDTFTYFESSFPRSPPPTSTTNPLLNLEPSWPRPLRPPFNPNSTTDMTGLITPSSSSSTAPVQALQPDPPSRVSKKRCRASRRAPTTVLTTDTSNFRAMVQEFTGIPTAPFSSTSTSTSNSRSRLPRYDSPYLLRPFAHKPHAASFLPSSSSSSTSLLDPPASTSGATVASSNQLSHDHLISAAGSMQNQVLNFQSLLQSPITNLPSFMANNKSDQVMNYGVTSHNVVAQVGGNLSNLVGSSEAMRSACSEFHSEKASDAARPPRTRGTVDSWICSSD